MGCFALLIGHGDDAERHDLPHRIFGRGRIFKCFGTETFKSNQESLCTAFAIGCLNGWSNGIKRLDLEPIVAFAFQFKGSVFLFGVFNAHRLNRFGVFGKHGFVPPIVAPQGEAVAQIAFPTGNVAHKRLIKTFHDHVGATLVGSTSADVVGFDGLFPGCVNFHFDALARQVFDNVGHGSFGWDMVYFNPGNGVQHVFDGIGTGFEFAVVQPICAAFLQQGGLPIALGDEDFADLCNIFDAKIPLCFQAPHQCIFLIEVYIG